MSDNVEPFLIPSSKSWQPSDFLPDPSSTEFMDAIQDLRKECENLPPEYLVVLVGDMVTEEALPSYMSMLNRMDGCKDHTGTTLSQHCVCSVTIALRRARHWMPLATWSRTERNHADSCLTAWSAIATHAFCLKAL